MMIDDINHDKKDRKINNEQGDGPPPAIACPLSGAYLIEASAGTGKTWTLTGIILRLLVQKNARPERIVATTFTRDAAKEMQERIYKRLQNWQTACLWLKRALATNLAAMDLYRCDQSTQKSAIQQAATDTAVLSDPINEYLLLWLLSEHPRQLDMALQRVSVLLSTLDKLFIGTLDSLAQKWLREFGASDNLIIQEKTPDLEKRIIHDTLRALYADLYVSTPKLMTVINAKVLTDVEAMHKNISKALQFFGTKIDRPNFDVATALSNLEQLQQQIKMTDFGNILRYCDEEFAIANGMNKRKISNFPKLAQIVDRFNQIDDDKLVVGFDKEEQTVLGWLKDDNSIAAIINTNHQAIWQNHHPSKLLLLYQYWQELNATTQQFEQFVIVKVALRVRDELPKLAREMGQSSFILQMLNLLDVLSGEAGKLICQHIRHLYPIALIDEAQDMNAEQTKLIEQIYLSKSAKKILFEKQNAYGFLLFVGDPKQAIYRFRGGDVSNYNYLKSLGVNTDYTLTQNRRSNKEVIDALNAWFYKGFDELGEQIYYEKITATRHQSHLIYKDNKKNGGYKNPLLSSSPINLLTIAYEDDNDKKLDIFNIIARHINTLLQSNIAISNEHTIRPIIPSDIAILCNTNIEIASYQQALNSYNIKTLAVQKDSVFNSAAATDLYYFFVALLNPSNECLGSLLTGIFGLTLAQSCTILDNETHKTELLLYLNQMHRLWHKQSLAAVFLAFFSQIPKFLGEGDLWCYLAKFEDSERYLIDLWQLFEILSVWQMHTHDFIKNLGDFIADPPSDDAYLRQNLNTDSGVQLMTMHKSKGLEFQIVYIIGMNAPAKPSEGIYPYSNDQHERRLSISDEHRENDKKESFDEKKRLAYVALTRASEQIFVVVQNKKRGFKDGIFKAWQISEDDKTFEVPSRLQAPNLSTPMTKIAINDDCSHFILTPYQEDETTQIAKHYQNFYQVIAKQRFDAIYRTSFTSLTRQFDQNRLAQINQNPNQSATLSLVGQGNLTNQTAEVYEYDEDFEDSIILSKPSMRDDLAIGEDIRFDFMRGAKAGIFVHKVLEKILHTQKTQNDIGRIISEVATAQNLIIEHQQNQLGAWFYQITHSPFAASSHSLAKLDVSYARTELSFLLAMPEGATAMGIWQIFEQYSDRQLPYFVESERLYHYLVGEIDLLYCIDDKYYIVDYKSNHLGINLNDYSHDNMAAVMDKNGYWLQAALYQLALHRLLKLRLDDYNGNESRYLGAVEYVFVRGIDMQLQATGRLVWDIPINLILALDEFFGTKIG